MSKFKVGQKVYCIIRGLGTVVLPTLALNPPVCVQFITGDRYYREDGKYCDIDLNPTLLTLEEARAKGYDVPKQRVVKVCEKHEPKRWFNKGEGMTLEPTCYHCGVELVAEWKEKKQSIKLGPGRSKRDPED